MGNAPPSQGHYLVAAAHESFYVRVVGLATMTNSVGLQEALGDLRRRGYRRFIFDLGSCSGFDSTFMGILIGVALDGAPGAGPGPTPPASGTPERDTSTSNSAAVVLVNASDTHTRLLAGVGIDRLVRVHQEPVRFPEEELRRLDDPPADPLRRIRSMVTAHENLVRVSGKAAAAFKRELAGDEPLPS